MIKQTVKGKKNMEKRCLIEVPDNIQFIQQIGVSADGSVTITAQRITDLKAAYSVYQKQEDTEKRENAAGVSEADDIVRIRDEIVDYMGRKAVVIGIDRYGQWHCVKEGCRVELVVLNQQGYWDKTGRAFDSIAINDILSASE